MNTDKLLNERESTHGDFSVNAIVSAQIIKVMNRWAHRQNTVFIDEESCALSQIALKLARLVSGGSERADSWRDIAGYAALALRALEQAEPKGDLDADEYLDQVYAEQEKLERYYSEQDADEILSKRDETGQIDSKRRAVPNDIEYDGSGYRVGG